MGVGLGGGLKNSKFVQIFFLFVPKHVKIMFLGQSKAFSSLKVRGGLVVCVFGGGEMFINLESFPKSKCTVSILYMC